MQTASWVIREKGTDRIVCETFEKRTVDSLDTNRYYAVPILEYLQSVNRSAQAPTKIKSFPGALVDHHLKTNGKLP